MIVVFGAVLNLVWLVRLSQSTNTITQLMIQFESERKHNHMSALTLSHGQLSQLATDRTAEKKLGFVTG